MQRWLGILVGVVVLAACTPGTSDPAPTTESTTAPMATPTERVDPVGRVAVVLDPRLGGATPTIRADLEGLDPEVAGGRTVRVQVAEDPSFVRDLAEFFAADGHELVCVLGPGAAEVVRQVAPGAPGTRFCAAPVGGDGPFPDNVLPLDVRVEELAYLAGVALGTEPDAGPVAALTRSPGGTPSRVRTGLGAGMTATAPVPVDVRVSAVAEGDVVGERARDLLADGARGLFGLVEPAALVDAVTSTPVGTPTPGDGPTPGPAAASAALVLQGPVADDLDRPPELLAVVEVHLHAAVVVALQRHLESWDPTHTSIGVAEGAIVAVPNDRARTSVGPALTDAASAIRAGDVTPPGAPTDAPTGS